MFDNKTHISSTRQSNNEQQLHSERKLLLPVRFFPGAKPCLYSAAVHLINPVSDLLEYCQFGIDDNNIFLMDCY